MRSTHKLKGVDDNFLITLPVAADVDSTCHTYKSDEVLAFVRPGLESAGFIVEKSKHSDDLVSVPVLYGQNGKIEKSFTKDAPVPYYNDKGVLIMSVFDFLLNPNSLEQ